MNVFPWRPKAGPVEARSPLSSPSRQGTAHRLPRPDESSLRTMRTLGKDPLAAPEAYFDQLGETFELSVLGTRFVFTRDPGWFDEVLVKQAKSFEKDRTTKNLGSLLGRGLLVRDGVAWRERRRLLSPPFLPAAVEGRLGLFTAETRRELTRWRAGTVVDLHAAMARLTMRIALGALFGYDAKDDEHFETQMAAAMRYFEGIAGTQIPLPTWIPTATNRAFVRARAEQRALADRLLERRAEEGTALAALQAGLASGHLTRQDVLDEVMTLLVAGHETSALSLTYLLAELGLAKELQEPVVRESREFAQPPTLADVTRGGAVQRTVLEGLRLYPVAWAVGREAIADVSVGEYVLARGTQVLSLIHI